MEIKRACDFIETPEGELYLNRPSTWLGGWARHLWFERCIGRKPMIASPEMYESLSSKYGTCQLIEYKLGLVRVLEPDSEKD